jgi:hypothetical protein
MDGTRRTGVLAVALGLFVVFTRAPKPVPRSSIAWSSRGAGQAPVNERRSAATSSGRVKNGSDTSANASMSADPFGVRRWSPRPADECQGMRVNLNISPFCTTSSHCGLGRACIDSKCVACGRDEDCATGEVCVLDHCLQKDLVACRRAADCDPHSKCVLSGYSNQPRGNEGTRAACVSSLSGADHGPVAPETRPKPDTRTSLPGDDLLRAAREAEHAK